MYLCTMFQAHARGCDYLTCDIIKGSYGKITTTLPIMHFLATLKLDRLIVVSRKDSYKSDALHGAEQFEQVTLNLNNLVTGNYFE
jgi:hypothetical protein